MIPIPLSVQWSDDTNSNISTMCRWYRLQNQYNVKNIAIAISVQCNVPNIPIAISIRMFQWHQCQYQYNVSMIPISLSVQCCKYNANSREIIVWIFRVQQISGFINSSEWKMTIQLLPAAILGTLVRCMTFWRTSLFGKLLVKSPFSAIFVDLF